MIDEEISLRSLTKKMKNKKMFFMLISSVYRRHTKETRFEIIHGELMLII
jgi:hypothetical protein